MKQRVTGYKGPFGLGLRIAQGGAAMTRDMQIGLLLAVGFLAVVGGVLYYRIEHPDELEHFWNGSSEVAQAKPAPGQDADVPAPEKPTDSQTSLPAAPAPSVPNMDFSPVTSAPTPAPVQPTDARGTNPNVAASTLNAGSPPALNFDVNPAPTLPKTETTPSGASGDKQKDADTKTAVQPSPPTFPDLNAQPKADKPASTANPSSATLPEPPSAGPPSLSFSTPTPPAPVQSSTTEKSKDDKSMWLNDGDKAKAPDSAPTSNAGGAQPVPPPVSMPLLNDIDPSKPAPAPATSTPTPALTSNPTPSTRSGQPQNETPKNVPDLNSSPLWLDSQPGRDSSLPRTSPLPSPPDVTPPAGNGSAGASASQNRTEGQYREYPAPRAGLGRPVPESVLAMNERRWSDGSNVPTPIIPSAGDSRVGTNDNVGASLSTERKVVNDTTISSIRVVQGETFSSLSQRAYGSETYAEALAAYNHEAGTVDADQPSGNQLVLIPAKFDLENRFGNLLRKQQFRSAPTNSASGSPSASFNTANRDPRNANTADVPTYRVRKGEQLFDVAKLTLGDGYRWGEIYSLNKDVLRESTELRADMMLRLPAEAKLDNGKPR